MNYGGRDVSSLSMLELFRIEVEQQSAILTRGLLSIEKSRDSEKHLTAMMRAAHSVKGAARLVNRRLVVELAHALEDCLTGVHNTHRALKTPDIDTLLKVVDFMERIANEADDDERWLQQCRDEYNILIDEFARVEHTNLIKKNSETEKSATPVNALSIDISNADQSQESVREERTLRVSARQLDRLMALAGEAMVQSRWLRPHTEAMRRLRREHMTLQQSVESLRDEVRGYHGAEILAQKLAELHQRAGLCRDLLEERVADLEGFDIRFEGLSNRFQTEMLASRMRPFRDGVEALPRRIRDIARTLNKDVELVIEGKETLVDRDVLERMEAPIFHLINNAVDHGIEGAATRVEIGKAPTGTVKVSAFHHGGALYISVEDDGQGIDFEALRNLVLRRRLVSEAVARDLSEQELTEFLFLPGFTTKEQVTEVSGRGVGLDVVREVISEMRGSVEAVSTAGRGTRFKLRLPLTLSVVPALLVDVGGEPYAFPMARIERLERVSMDEIVQRGHRHVVMIDGKELDVVVAASVLEVAEKRSPSPVLSVVVLRDRDGAVGCVVDRFRGEAELVVQPLPETLGKIQDLTAVALMEDGTPALILDVEDMMRSARKLIETGDSYWSGQTAWHRAQVRKRILVVDDSLTVRELERKLLASAGYEVDVAVDGMDGWNAVRNQVFDMVITDIDMPRLNGFQLVRMIKSDPALSRTPVLVVTYKDRDQDEARAYEVGADLFLTKAKFHDDVLREAVKKLIGEALS